MLTEALAAIKESASDEMMRRYDLVWFAKYRCKFLQDNGAGPIFHSFPYFHCTKIGSKDRYPNHKESKRIDQQHKAEIEKLRSEDGDFHHGFNTGLLAAARMFKDKADVAHINKFEELTPGLLAEASKHRQRIQEARGSFPQTEVTNDFPKQEN